MIRLSTQKGKPEEEDDDDDEDKESDDGEMMMVSFPLHSKSFITARFLVLTLNLSPALQSAEDAIAAQAKQDEEDPYANLSKKEKKKKKKQVITSFYK